MTIKIKASLVLLYSQLHTCTDILFWLVVLNVHNVMSRKHNWNGTQWTSHTCQGSTVHLRNSHPLIWICTKYHHLGQAPPLNMISLKSNKRRQNHNILCGGNGLNYRGAQWTLYFPPAPVILIPSYFWCSLFCFNNLWRLAAFCHFFFYLVSCYSLFAPCSHSTGCCYIPSPPPSSAASLWHGTFRQTQAMLFEQCLLLDGPSFIFTHGAFPVPEQLYTWLHMELKEQAESLSPAKEQQHWAACLLLPCLRSQSKRRE